jgi:hypothetical protein
MYLIWLGTMVALSVLSVVSGLAAVLVCKLTRNSKKSLPKI